MSYLETNGNSYETWIAPETGREPRPTRSSCGRCVRTASADHRRHCSAAAATISAYELSGRVRQAARLRRRDRSCTQRLFSPLDDFYGLSPIQVAALT
jgi:hypothetical protein